MRRNVKIASISIGLIAVLAAALFLLKPRLYFLLFGAAAGHDSPIEVAGGSIHGLANKYENVWTQDETNSELYSAPSLAGNDKITLHGMVSNTVKVGDGNGNLQVTGTGGWRIVFYPSDTASGDAKPEIEFCSALDTSTAFHRCDGTSLGDGQGVYVHAAGESHFKLVKGAVTGNLDELHYHDRSNGCDNPADSGDTEGICDNISTVEISLRNPQLPAGAYKATYTCANEKDCCVIVGDSSITDCYK